MMLDKKELLYKLKVLESNGERIPEYDENNVDELNFVYQTTLENMRKEKYETFIKRIFYCLWHITGTKVDKECV